jgi:hypothetical protein
MRLSLSNQHNRQSAVSDELRSVLNGETSQARYAIYLAPSPEQALWHFGCNVLGYNAETGEDVPGFRPVSKSVVEWHASTERARVYGFHATLKAPFRLASEFQERELVQALALLASRINTLSAIPLKLDVLDGNSAGGFLALVPAEPSPAIHTLEQLVVREMDRFRAPLTDAEIARRNPSALSSRQRQHLDQFGYPFVFEDFQLHFTLSDRLAEAQQVRLELQAVLNTIDDAPAISVDHLALFRQPSQQERFRVIARVPLRSS